MFLIDDCVTEFAKFGKYACSQPHQNRKATSVTSLKIKRKESFQPEPPQNNNKVLKYLLLRTDYFLLLVKSDMVGKQTSIIDMDTLKTSVSGETGLIIYSRAPFCQGHKDTCTSEAQFSENSPSLLLFWNAKHKIRQRGGKQAEKDTLRSYTDCRVVL